LGRLVIKLTLPSEVEAEARVYEYQTVEEGCAEWEAEACMEEGLSSGACAERIERTCPKVICKDVEYTAVVEGRGVISKEGAFPVKALSMLTVTYNSEENPPALEVEYETKPEYPNLDEPFEIRVTYKWDWLPRVEDAYATLRIHAILEGMFTYAEGEGRATTRVKFPPSPIPGELPVCHPI
jgi:hypothetical protein